MLPTIDHAASAVEYAARPRGVDVDEPAAAAGSSAQIRQAARQFEALFMDMMLRAMRQAQGEDDALFGSSAVSSYQAMMDSHLSDTLAGRGGGFGVADLLADSLSGRRTPGGSEGAALAVVSQVSTDSPAPVRPGTGGVDSTSDVAPADRAPDDAGLRQPGNPQAFVRQLFPLAQRHAAELGVAPQVLLAQAALETGWGAHVMGDAVGGSSHNLFGIKATDAWHGQRTAHRTLEFADGIAQQRVEPFRVYDGFDAAFADYVALIKGSARYANAVDRSHEPAGYLRELQAAGYATDPHYADKILAILERLPDPNASAEVAGSVDSVPLA